MGALDHISELFDCSHPRKKRKQFQVTNYNNYIYLLYLYIYICLLISLHGVQTVEVKVKMDCEGCERKVKKAVDGMKGVSQVEVDRKASKVTVSGYVEPSKVVSRIAHRTGKRAELWPYVPYDVVDHPYAPGVYDRKAPSGYVRNADADPRVYNLARATSAEVRYTTAFSDENPSACVVM
ncbi:hypothetical protein Fmac_022481 [Flemingia macrophylla]|uniref:HMA domain-containing protein n=1 Tax=Flemingia macrophylla TaxID=520843 RepID=A0ABD1LZU2_9FABA